MPRSKDAVRRWTGAICLFLAAGLLIAGQTWLRDALDGFRFLGYWFLCFLFTSLAMICSVLDLRAVRKRTRAEQLELIERTLNKLPPKPEDS